jgi:release factor glutamine methyltransferase
MEPEPTMDVTIRDALADAVARLVPAGVPEPRADAEVLLAHALDAERAALIVRAREPLPARAAARFEESVRRRLAREPVAYITGEREFWSLPFRVDRRVLIPRPETETLIATALRLAPQARRVLDVCTGSGVVAVTLARELSHASVTASDRFAPALAVAAENRARLAPRVGLLQGDLLAPFRAGAFDLVVANPPYCAEGTVVQAEVRDWEPATALYAGPDGLRRSTRSSRPRPACCAPEAGSSSRSATASATRSSRARAAPVPTDGSRSRTTTRASRGSSRRNA